MNLIFNASAGTGKTWQVTELYSALVLGCAHEHLPPDREPVAPEKILLMTFTDNAAAELRERVSKKMVSAESDALEAGEFERADRARRVLRSLPAAHISTIHAFCAGLLREHALELGLSPAFQTLEEDARDALLEEVLKEEIFRALENDADFRDFCAGISVLGDHDYSLIHTIRSLLEKADSRGMTLEDAERLLPPATRTVTKQSFERIRDELESQDLPKTAAVALDALIRALVDFPDVDLMAAVPRFGQARKVKHLSDELAELKDRFIAEALYAEHIETFRAFARCLSACAQHFAEAKRERDSVDFGDQLLMARDLLNGKKFDEPLFDWIIVDEVQDTSRVQCEVIEALWADETQLVICGDKKQSIYAWRSADPDVMPELERRMGERGECRRIDLKTSYRSKDRVIDAVNTLFDALYESYDALEPLDALAGEKPCVEFLAPDDDGQGVEEEMAAAARRIRLLVDGDGEWQPKFGHDGEQFVEGEPFRYGDILILLKRSTHQAVLERALREQNIPYTSGGKGKALFEQQEVRDLLLFLQVLCEPFNDLALVGFLRSPFAGLPDDEIVKLGWDGETFDHEILRRQFVGSGHPVAERLLRYQAQTGEKLASQLVREMVRETAFDAQLVGEFGGEQKLANFKKALDWLRAAERGGQVLLPDVVRRFEKAIQTPPRSGAAEALLPDPEQNAVTLMTVHGAKGLTRRVCFVPDISFGDVTEPGFAMLSQSGLLEMSLSDVRGGKVKSPGWDVARTEDKAVRDRESLNVFYVAMTRARDLVVLSGAGTQRPDGWLKLSEGFLQDADSEILRTLPFSEVPSAELSEEMESDVCEFAAVYQPLRVPAGLIRTPVTSLVHHEPEKFQVSDLSGDRRSFGTLGHLVLEELAKNGWVGDIPALVELFGAEFGALDTVRLTRQLESARDALQKETDGAVALFTEHPFVLRRSDLILDGTIDLLAQMPENRWKVLDYKFTASAAEDALDTYAPQLNAYMEAVAALHPGAEVSARLVLIRDEADLVSVPIGCLQAL